MGALKTYLFVFLGVTGAFSLYLFCKKQTDGFTLKSIHSSGSIAYPYMDEPSRLSSTQIDTILSQPFYYLGKGAQSFAFVSQDNQYVIKFFRHRQSYFLQSITFLFPPFIQSRLEARIKKRHYKLYKDFFSYTLAYQMLPKETGLLYLHLRKTDHLHKTLTLYDKIGIKQEIALDPMEFVIQQKAELFYPTLEKWIEEGEILKAKRNLTQLIALFKKRCELGIRDKDPNLETNVGFVGDTPIQFDIGRLNIAPVERDPKVYTDELIRITDFLRVWLDQKCPELSEHLQQELTTPEVSCCVS